MKKILLSLILTSALMITSCSASNGASPSEETKTTTAVTTTSEVTTTTSETTTEENKVSEDSFQITPYLIPVETYTEVDTVCFLKIKNTSSATVGLSFNVLAHDAEDKVLGASNGSLNILGPEEESLAFVVFSNVEKVDHVSYTMKIDESVNRESIVGKLAVKPSINKSNIVLTVTNNGEKAAKKIEAVILMFDSNDKLVDFSAGYIVEDYDELAPGATASKQIDTYKKFDHIQIYFVDHSI